MMINTCDSTKTTKASCIMSFKVSHDRARLDSIFIACGNLLVIIYDYLKDGGSEAV